MNLTALLNTPIGPCEKSLPASAAGRSITDVVADEPRLSDFSTPLITLDDAAMSANIARLAAYCADHGMALAPHGKTTMAPQLWQRQMDAGAWGITVANSSQVRVARTVGATHVQLANGLLDPHGLHEAQDMAAEGIEFLCWVDSADTVDRMAAHLDPEGPAIGVIAEIGAAGGRTGARGVDAGIEVATAIHECPRLELRGVGGYEGALAHDRSAHGLEAVAAYLTDMRALHERVLALNLYDTEQVYVTAGGSAYFDQVAEIIAPVADTRTTVLLRSGAYIIHDDGFYRMISPLSPRVTKDDALRPAMHGWARVVSRPEPGLALLDAGKRDFPFDEGLPEPQLAATELGRPTRALEDAEVTAMNDQHTFLSLPAEDPLAVGDVVRLGLSHPCTALDKWRYLPSLAAPAADDPSASDPRVVDLIHTCF